MRSPSDETLFAAFRRHRDVDALALLFRRRADELLRIAVFLSPRPSDAEDLVQATFLSAIARAETFRPEHRVMSWLCGILTNHARMLRRAERRTAPERPADSDATDPVSSALRSELRTALADSIRTLPEPYRSVLTLHLNDGLNSREISQRLHRPPATVRKQMERAIRQLRTALPLGLATAVVVRMSPAQIAERAAEAAEFVPVDPPTDDTPATRTALRTGWPWLAIPVAAAAILFATLDLWSDRATSEAGATTTAGQPAAAVVAALEPNDEAGRPGVAVGTQPDRERPPPSATEHTLAILAKAPDGSPHAATEVFCVPIDGRSLPTRLMVGTVHRATTDEHGRARFLELPSGRYDLAIAGATAIRQANIDRRDVDLVLELPPRQDYSGFVTDQHGKPVVGATVLVTQTSGRGDLATELATTDATGSFAGSCPLVQGRICARHRDHGQSVCLRLSPGQPIHLRLEDKPAPIAVVVTDDAGRPGAGAFVAIVPKSQDTDFYVPQVGIADAAGRCTLPGPGSQPATAIAQLKGFAPTRAELLRGDDAIEIELQPATTVSGTATLADGTPLSGREVGASVAGARTNEPVAPLSAQTARTDQDGRFVIAGVPRARVQLRIYGSERRTGGPPMSHYVIAAADVDTRDGAVDGIELRAHERQRITGTLRTTNGRAIAGWHVLAVPETGTAAHRMFRRRAALVADDGTFTLPAITPTEPYQLGFYPPDRWWPNAFGWPVAIASARADRPCAVAIDPSATAGATLHCQVLLPDGRPCGNGVLELRNLAFHAPMTCRTDPAGRAHFEGLPAGNYWLAVNSAGLGNRTLRVEIPSATARVDLGALQLERAARVAVRLLGRFRKSLAGVHVLARNLVGDKYVSATTASNGTASLRPLPPGPSELLLHGPGIAPQILQRDLEPGVQWLDLDVQPATPVTLRFPFALADNPFLLNGPLHVRILDATDRPVLTHYVGATAVRGRFDLATGLRPGRYRVIARSLWNALADEPIDVPDGDKQRVFELRLRPR